MTSFTYSDLVQWSKEKLPVWQQDALRRILEKSTLVSKDIAELAELAKAPHLAERLPGAIRLLALTLLRRVALPSRPISQVVPDPLLLIGRHVVESLAHLLPALR